MKLENFARSTYQRLLGIGSILLLALSTAPATWAQDEVQAQTENQAADPPSRVARISYLNGPVSMQPGGAGDWGNAEINRPMTIGDRLWTDENARAELQVGAATIHLNSKTALSFLNLDDNTVQMRMAEGSMNFNVRDLRDGEVYEVDTPNVAFTVKHAGTFRVDVNEQGDQTGITALYGDGEVTAAGKSYTVHEREHGEFNGAEDVGYSITATEGPDSFDDWAMQRDARGEKSETSKYVSPEVTGSQDLDDYGTWQDTPDNGPTWYPTSVAVGWAPYSYGYWGWVGPWGWTWVDYAPWGFAPFHYGRWAYNGGRWGWCPGAYYGRPVYAPALVGFVGGAGFGFSVGFGFGHVGGVGWFPLGPHEPYYPWYRGSGTYVRNVNITNTTIRNVNVLNTSGARNFNYAYAHNTNAVTSMSQSSFANGERVNRSTMRMAPNSLRNAQVISNPAVQPTQHALQGGVNSGATVRRPPASVQSRPVVTRTPPSPGASHLPVRAANGSTPMGGRNNAPVFSAANRPTNSPMSGSINSPMSGRQHELQMDKPQGSYNANTGRVASAPTSRQAGNSPRSWSAQGNATDSGRAPAGFGREPIAPNAVSNGANANPANRPPWARGSAGAQQAPAGSSRVQSNNGSYRGGNSGRSYQPPPSYNRGSSAPRSYSPPPRSNSAPSYSAPPRSYSPPARSYSAPSRSYSAPSGGSRGSSGGYSGGGSHGGGGGSSASHGHR